MENVILPRGELVVSRLPGIMRGHINLQELKTEIIRKSIHFFIALSPGMAMVNRPATIAMLMAGTLGYICLETLRLSGVRVPLVSSLTNMASRSRDIGHFVFGPVTLGIGALLALLLYPLPVAFIGIYALAFGDGFASLIGKLFGRIRPVFLLGKSLEGSLACFIVVLVTSYQVSYNYTAAIMVAITATLVEALPLKDYDNLAIPIISGFVAGITL